MPIVGARGDATLRQALDVLAALRRRSRRFDPRTGFRRLVIGRRPRRPRRRRLLRLGQGGARGVRGGVSAGADDGGAPKVGVGLETPDAMITEAAVEAVKQWTHEPATKHGKPVKVRLTVTVAFKLS